MLLSPSVLLESASTDGRVACCRLCSKSALSPMAVLSSPVVLLRAHKTVAVLPLPVELPGAHHAPVAVLWMPVVLVRAHNSPMAVLSLPVVLFRSAS